MHQAHNIPWHILSTHLKAAFDDNRVTPTRSHITPKNAQDPALQPALVHFIRKFTAAIRAFSETERLKYPATFDAPTSGPLFSDTLKARYPDYLNSRNQDIALWIAQGPHYHTSHGDFADVIKVLIHEREMETLLMLANHPLIRIRDLHMLSWGHHFGWSRTKEEALSAYLFFNTAEALGILEDQSYTNLNIYGGLLNTLASRMDFPAQQVTHREFFQDIGLLESIEKMPWDYEYRIYKSKSLPVHKDYTRFQGYIKKLFEVLYMYDVVARECGLEDGPGGPLNWEVDIAKTVPFLGIVKVEDEYLEDENSWIHYLKPKST
ncbi:hypothetical protein CVT24_006374 [Panaeolus cyanescens]|uniref:Uncharacterized protein n=1 Tax=Panaeolus cyanescens TaxID=181874 RepID=A0A409YE75_9AGAR|nr:hypothetical protein CVT24_006374 [Panaeolus cyanescens]